MNLMGFIVGLLLGLVVLALWRIWKDSKEHPEWFHPQEKEEVGEE